MNRPLELRRSRRATLTALRRTTSAAKEPAVADASGSSSTLADTVTYNRLRDVGVTVQSTFGAWSELYPDLSTPEGQRAEAVAAGMPIPA